MLSPFFGGGSIELFMAANDVQVFGYDVFVPLVEFWQCLQQDAKQLAAEVEKYYPLTKEKFYQLQASQHNCEHTFKRAAEYYVLNRCSFSGSTLSGGMSPMHPRFTISSIERIAQFYNPNFSVKAGDFSVSLRKHSNVFTYLDPPYLIRSSLYGKKGNAHKNFDHLLLAELLAERNNWIMSYNDCDEIREVYKQYTIISPEWKYGMSNDKSSREVLIFSADVCPLK